MYLLHTSDLTLRKFFSMDKKYAILSHIWHGEVEVMFQDVVNRSKNGLEEPAGWKKVKGACNQARNDGWEWIWIDSCCIDKSSSAELSENINSMYRLYENAVVCYVYLSDVSSNEQEKSSDEEESFNEEESINRKDPRDPGSDFRYSEWFTRGWTLQELIAPSASVVFFDRSWEEIGTRSSLRDVISAITSVPVGLLEDGDLTKYSIAQKMSWAAFRETTRPEDRAYSLMGLFDISMPPIYGEGEAKAFRRLQQEIIKTSDDRSIFAWVADCKSNENGDVLKQDDRGLLAQSPDEFKGSSKVGISTASFPKDTSSFSFNNNGLHIHFPIVPIPISVARASLKCQADGDMWDIVRASLNCQVDDADSGGAVCNIYLRKMPAGHYVRCHPDKLVLHSFETPGNVQEVIVKEISPSRETRKRSYKPSQLNEDVDLLPEAKKHFENVTARRSVTTTSVTYIVNFNRLHSDETVCISFDSRGGGVLSMRSSKTGLLEGSWYTDSLTMPLGPPGGFATAAVRITGNDRYGGLLRKITINYTESSVLIPTLRCPQFVEIVPGYPLHKVFPPSHSDRGPSDDLPSHSYLFLSKEASSACRILAYDESQIAIGINKSGKVWIDETPRSGETCKDIWDSYQEDGSRKDSKENTSISVIGSSEKATVHKNDGFQFASHSLVLPPYK